MNYAIILAAGVGQRMRNGGLPKQFLKLLGKPIIIYTLEKFQQHAEIDKIIVVCHGSYIDYMNRLIDLYRIGKVLQVVVGGSDRQGSLERGISCIKEHGGTDGDIVLIHDGVRPLVSEVTIHENIRVAKEHGCAMTVHPVTESVVITDTEEAGIENFQKRADTYSLTAPQTFLLGALADAYGKVGRNAEKGNMPLLDAAMVFAGTGREVHLVKEQGTNIKVTTPDDYYFLKTILELEETKYIFGL
ncbi:MAG: 2-C-methyl-D-erythritol 4-phosphate cytidylyltransferase [Treponema sp.]|nr:2-C-methyl-D-erythritol 4-phosphate cytidylyltransferase [Treponema sp.]